jgi:outer membrane protein assembly factor BamA
MAKLPLILSLACAALGAAPARWAASDSAVAAAMAEGYLQARSDSSGSVIKGPLFLLGNVQVTGTARTAAELGLAAFPGEPAAAAAFKAAGESARRFFLDHGYPFASVSLDFVPRDGAGPRPVVDLRVDVAQGEGWKFGGYKAYGSRTLPEVLDRLTLLRYGEDYSEARLAKAMERLARTGYYEAAAPGALYRDSTRNLLYPSLALTDLKGNRLDGVMGYDSQRDGAAGLNGYLDIHLINLRGTARDLDFSFRGTSTGQSAVEKDARLAFTEPWVLGLPVGARVDLHFNLEDSVYGEGSGEIQVFQDVDFRSRYFVSAARQYTYDYVSLRETWADVAGLGLQYDGRDRVPSTLRGVRFSARVNGLRRDLGDSSYFLAQTIDQFAVWANRGRWVAYGLLAGSGNWPLERRDNRGDLFPLGGSNTIRGFREREFLTNLFGYANLELQYLLAPGSRASVFAVPAFINRLDGSGGAGDIYWRRVIGYGVGLESGGKDWTFGVSYALNPDRSFGNGFIHLRVINNF